MINIYHNKHGKTRGDFTNEFQSSWANSLLPHHPEYDRLMYSETVLQPSFDWISDFLKTETFADALSKNYIVVSTTQSTADFDPFYAIAVTLKSGMSGKVNNDFKKGLSMWKIAYGQVKYRNVISDAGRGDQYALSPPLPFADLTTFEKDEAWKTFRNLYAAERDLDINSHINTVKPLADDAALIAQGYKLHFPATNRQIADQNKWDWYPYVGGAPPVNVGLSPAAVANQYMSRCQSYVPEWKRVLLNCPAIRDRADRDAVVLQIILKMLDVCQKGSDPANEFGSSTVPSGFL